MTTWAQVPDTIMFQRRQQERFQLLAEYLEAVVASNAAAGIDPLAVEYDARPARVVDSTDDTPVGFATTIPPKVAKYLKKHDAFLPGETVRAVVGDDPQVLIATERRLLVVKVGFLAASTGGGRTTAFNYADITSIQVQLGMLMGTLSVQSPGYGGTQTGDYWSTRNQQNAQSLPNVIPWSKPLDRKFARELTWVRQCIDQARNPALIEVVVTQAAAAAPAAGDMAAQLERLAQLHADGTLTDEEFAAAKARLIG